ITSIGASAFDVCPALLGVYFKGNAPSVDPPSAFPSDSRATVYYVPGTTGWGPTFDGRPTALWVPLTTIQIYPQSQTAEAGWSVEFRAVAAGNPVLRYRWFFNGSNNPGGTNRVLQLADIQSPQAGAYTVVASDAFGSVTSPPAVLSVIPRV